MKGGISLPNYRTKIMNNINFHNIIKIEVSENKDMYPEREDSVDLKTTFSRHIKIHWHDHLNNINTTDICLFSTNEDDQIEPSQALEIKL